jgi:hypothetical protein
MGQLHHCGPHIGFEQYGARHWLLVRHMDEAHSDICFAKPSGLRLD